MYEFILFDINGTPIGDISRLCKNRKWSKQRNRADEISFMLPLNLFEAYATSNGLTPRDILEPYQTEIKVRRNGTYIAAGVVAEVNLTLPTNNMTIDVRAFGYFDLLKDRYVTPAPFEGVEGTSIAWGLIDETQSTTNGDMGITQGTLVTTVTRDRTEYRYQNVQDGIINLSNLSDYSFDFEITPDKVFNTYTEIGSLRSDVLLVYPGNIIDMKIPRNATKLFNSIYALGSGFDDDQVRTYVEDVTSQLNYGRHEKVQTWNSVVEPATLEQNATTYLNDHKDLLQIPQIKQSGAKFDLDTFGIGDRFPVQIVGHNFATLEGNQRIERLEVDIDENDAEQINTYFDRAEDEA